MDSLVKSAPGAKWTHSAPVDLGKINKPETIDLLGHGNTPGTIEYCKLNIFSTIGLTNMDNPVKSAPGVKWTHSAPVDIGKIDVPKTIDLLKHSSTPRAIDYCKLNTFSTIGLTNMGSSVKSAPGAKWTHSAPVDLGKIDTPEPIDLLGHGNTPGTIDYCKLDTFSTTG